MNNLPLVSVLIPSYNHEKYIEEAILSIVNQTYKNIELIVIDDGSTDNSPALIEMLSQEYGFMYKHRKNKGLIYTLEEMKKFANGKYISLFSSDDIFNIYKIEKLVDFLEKNDNFAMVYSKMIIIDSNGNETLRIDEEYKGGNIFCNLLRGDFYLNGLTSLIRMEVYKTFSYSEKLYIDDLYMWLKIAEKHQIGFVDDYLTYYRKHANHLSGNLLKMQESEELIINQYKDKKCYKDAINEWNLRWFHNMASNDKNIAFKKYFLRVIKPKNFFKLKFYKALIRLILLK